VPPTATPVGDNCTYTQGYWKNHPEEWPVTSLVLGNTTYNQSQLLAIFNTSPGGDATYILAHQLIAAKLNIANGANPSAVAQTVIDSDNWLIANPIGSNPGNPARAVGIALAGTLDDYNNGEIGPGHCGDEPNPTPTNTPTVTKTPTRTPTATRTPSPVPPTDSAGARSRWR